MQEEGHSRKAFARDGNGQLPAGPGELVLVCGAEDFCAEARRELQRRRKDLRAVAADNLDGARQLMEEHTPAVILAEERVMAEGGGSRSARRQALTAGVALLAGYAPLVWIGGAEECADISPALRFAEVDFVPRSALCLPAAITMVERRLRSAAGARKESVPGREIFSPGERALNDRDFGELLRHELNNPLTGILGNAELLLLEVRRGKLELPPQTRQRLETITALAVRMRETVRQLSDRWEGAGGNLPADKQPAAEHSHWPVTG